MKCKQLSETPIGVNRVTGFRKKERMDKWMELPDGEEASTDDQLGN